MLLSVIIPYYNASSTLPEALDSILGQGDVPSAEFIFVNDGSNDGSNLIVEEFAGSHPYLNIKIISHHDNLGVGSAIATGLKAAEGKYVTRLDADDILLPGALRLLSSEAEAVKADIVCSSYILDWRGKKSKTVHFPKGSVNLNRLPIDRVSFSLWAKLIKRSLLENNGVTTIPGINCWEDLYVTARAFALAGNVSVIQQPTYRYRVNPEEESVSRQSKEIVLNDRIAYAEVLEKWFADKGIHDEFLPFLDRLKFMAKIKFLRSPQRDFGAWLNTFPEINRRILNMSHVPLWVRMASAALGLLPAKAFQPR